MAEPVTAAELANALRDLVGATFTAVCVTERLRVFEESLKLLVSYDAQQSEHSKPAPVLVPTHRCSIADSGDFDECCIVCGESTDGGHSPERCVENIESATFQAIEFEREFLKAQSDTSKPALSEVEHSRQVNVASLDPGDVLCVKRGGVVHEVWENKVNELEDVHVDVRLIDPSMCPIDHGTITGWCARCGKRAI